MLKCGQLKLFTLSHLIGWRGCDYELPQAISRIWYLTNHWSFLDYSSWFYIYIWVWNWRIVIMSFDRCMHDRIRVKKVKGPTRDPNRERVNEICRIWIISFVWVKVYVDSAIHKWEITSTRSHFVILTHYFYDKVKVRYTQDILVNFQLMYMLSMWVMHIGILLRKSHSAGICKCRLTMYMHRLLLI